MTFFAGNGRECKRFIKLLLDKGHAQHIKKINYTHAYKQEDKKIHKTNEHCLIIQTEAIELCKKHIETHKDCGFCLTLQ